MTLPDTSRRTDPDAEPDREFTRLVTARFVGTVPQVGALGITVEPVEGFAVKASMPTRAEFVGDLERGIIHTGVVTSLIDSICGLAVLIRIGRPDAIATLDLRVDYLRPTLLGGEIHCLAECFRLTDQIAFARATVWQNDEREPVATSVSAFMRGNAPRRGFT